ncbi:putative S-adenosyl-L-methionine-dependent methyltransferase TehB [bacterium BMS3Abin04]|nr:putative S-adenosyl-L-methionine-dependent methyltransferase TehB [bacterium BMS3Abin04]
MNYDKEYSRIANVFGEEPETVLKSYYHKINNSLPVLDLGAGQGRNSFFLARKGFVVDAVDPSKVGIDIISTEAEKENLSIHTYQCGFNEFIPPIDSYSCILIFGLIQNLSRESIEIILAKINEWTEKESLVFITGFTTLDASFNEYAQKWDLTGKNSFAGEGSNIRTYLEPEEILSLFQNYKVIYHREGMGPKHRHGDGPLEQHAMVEAVFQKQ